MEIIREIKQYCHYFNINNIREIFSKNNISITNSTLKTYIHYLSKEEKFFNSGKGWYSFIKNSFNLNKEPIKKIVKELKEKLPLLDFSCWSTEQLNPYTHHILSKYITFIYVETDYMPITAETLKEIGYNAYLNPTKSEIEKFFKVEQNTLVIRPSIYNQPSTKEEASPIEKILVDFLIENSKFLIMENEEVENMLKEIVISGRINMASFLGYAKRRKISDIVNKLLLNNIILAQQRINQLRFNLK